MDLTIPGICFLTSSIQLEFETDGHVTHFEPAGSRNIDADHTLVLARPLVQQHRMTEIPAISLFDEIPVSDDLAVPEAYNGTQSLHGKRVLILMPNGWGDTILIQPELRDFYRMVASSGTPPHITLGCNWIHSFPYRDVPYVHDLRPNIMTLNEFCSFDILVNLIPVDFRLSRDRSIRDLCTDTLSLPPEYDENNLPTLNPNPRKVLKFVPLFDQIRKETGKKLLCVNWKSRFHHEDAPAELFNQIIIRLRDTYQAVLFKDEESSSIMQKEIYSLNAPVVNLSSLIYDYHDTIAVLSHVDAFVSVDTGIVHAAGAMGIPGVALFGPFPPETHAADYPYVVPVSASFRGKVCRGPCLEAHRGCAEVNYSRDVVSPCFEAINVDHVLQAFNEAVNRKINDAKVEQRRNGAQKQIGIGYRLAESSASMIRGERRLGSLRHEPVRAHRNV